MILRIMDKHNIILGAKDVDGTKWIANLNSFRNAETIYISISRGGTPFKGRTVTDLGVPISNGGPILNDGRPLDPLVRGDTLAILPGKWVISF